MAILTSEWFAYVLAAFKRNEVHLTRLLTSTDTHVEEHDTKLKSEYHITSWTRGSLAVKAVCYKPEGRGFDIR
jgi:hypothetical protein